MPKRFEIEVERRRTERLTVVVEGDDLKGAASAARTLARVNEGSELWAAKGEEYVPTQGVETDAELGIRSADGIDRLVAYYNDDPEFRAFYSEQMDGDAPAYIVLDDRGTLFFGNAGRDEFAAVRWDVHSYAVVRTSDPMKLLDPEADVYHEGDYPDVEAAVTRACEVIGHPMPSEDAGISP